MDLLIDSYAWIIVSGWGYWLALLGVGICLACWFGRRLDGLLRFAIGVFFAISTVATAVVTWHTDQYGDTARALQREAPEHPVLEEVARFEQARDWHAAVAFTREWQDFRRGEDLARLREQAVRQNSAELEAITAATEKGALSETRYQQWVQTLQEQPVRD
ncbi:MAG: hypothetical protein R3296_02660 [Oleiphilaceae bacterium]|nr:hypothetical protein [Oleiphilaceae bacterium]